MVAQCVKIEMFTLDCLWKKNLLRVWGAYPRGAQYELHGAETQTTVVNLVGTPSSSSPSLFLSKDLFSREKGIMIITFKAYLT